jgi:hypothetical protein
MKEKSFMNIWQKGISEKLSNFCLVLISFSLTFFPLFSCVHFYKEKSRERQETLRLAECSVPYAEEDIKLAKDVFYNIWYNKFGDSENKLAENLALVCVIFEPDKWIVKGGYFIDGRPLPVDGYPVIGQALSKTLIVVYSKDLKQPIHKTSFAHELVHVSLLVLNESADPDHLGGEYPGWTKEHNEIIQEVNRVLKILEI